jgi:ABC-type transport system involved in multi-copper enzyme maturation permease subunit
MFIVCLNVCLHISIWIFIGTVKKTWGKFLFFNGFSDMTFLLTTSWIISDKSKNQGISEKNTKEEKFSANVFFKTNVEVNYKHILIFLWRYTYVFIQSYWKCFTEHPSNENFRNQHFPGLLHWKFGKVTPKIRQQSPID